MSNIPTVSADQIKEAMKKFDEEFRNQPQFIGWESNGNQRYAIDVDGKRYPPKKIISIATGLRVSEFSGGNESNDYLKKLGFEVIEILDVK